MKIVLNAHGEDAGSKVCIYDLYKELIKKKISASLNDWENYDKYDFAIFMGYDEDIARARSQNPRIKIVIADPKISSSKFQKSAYDADLLVVSSIEQRDKFLSLSRNVFVYQMFPDVQGCEKKHVSKSPTIIGYHGNRVHLECMALSVKPALEALAHDREIEFWAIYNIEKLGKAKLGCPSEKYVKVRHIQWHTNVYEEIFPQIDVGIVPNEMPIKNKLKWLYKLQWGGSECMNQPFDHLIRLKASCNAGRIYPFSVYGIPIISDFSPSAAQFIEDGVSGFLVSSEHGWYHALDILSADSNLRNSFAKNLRRKTFAANQSRVSRLIENLKNLKRIHLSSKMPDLILRESVKEYSRYSRPVSPFSFRLKSIIQGIQRRVNRL